MQRGSCRRSLLILQRTPRPPEALSSLHFRQCCKEYRLIENHSGRVCALSAKAGRFMDERSGARRRDQPGVISAKGDRKRSIRGSLYIYRGLPPSLPGHGSLGRSLSLRHVPGIQGVQIRKHFSNEYFKDIQNRSMEQSSKPIDRAGETVRAMRRKGLV